MSDLTSSVWQAGYVATLLETNAARMANRVEEARAEEKALARFGRMTWI
jgi:hypothetical protein